MTFTETCWAILDDDPGDNDFLWFVQRGLGELEGEWTPHFLHATLWMKLPPNLHQLAASLPAPGECKQPRVVKCEVRVVASSDYPKEQGE